MINSSPSHNIARMPLDLKSFVTENPMNNTVML
jgi:hypothetical protein